MAGTTAKKQPAKKSAAKKSKVRAKSAPPKLRNYGERTSTAEKAASLKEVYRTIGKEKVRITNSTKIYWPKEKITKGEVIDYYQSVSKYILPYLKDRPQSLKRNPNGILDKGFYHKNAGEEAPDFVKTISLYSPSSDRDVEYLVCNDAATLAYMNNLGCIELNPWHSTLKSLDKPDYLVLDIDPSPKNDAAQIIETARAIHDVLLQAGADSYCKTSGASGLHIYVPTSKKYTYDQVRDFAQIVCSIAHDSVESFTSMERNLKKRGNRIYLDYLQNGQGQTIASVYSLRPYPNASASTPLDWKEVKAGLVFADHNIKSLPARLAKKGDLFKAVLGKGIDLRKCLKNLGA